jgi:hypothetical protein
MSVGEKLSLQTAKNDIKNFQQMVYDLSYKRPFWDVFPTNQKGVFERHYFEFSLD